MQISTSISRRILVVAVLAVVGAAMAGCTTPREAGEPASSATAAGTAAEAAQVLDALHAAASVADGDAYFDLFAADGVFIGTDPAERWTLTQFRAYAGPHFERGTGWTYHPRPSARHVQVERGGKLAWFDEILDNDKYGECRGTGVLRRVGDSWKIAQYSLSVPIPNDLTLDVVERIREFRRDGK